VVSVLEWWGCLLVFNQNTLATTVGSEEIEDCFCFCIPFAVVSDFTSEECNELFSVLSDNDIQPWHINSPLVVTAVACFKHLAETGNPEGTQRFRDPSE
jgi:hypothetical protein